MPSGYSEACMYEPHPSPGTSLADRREFFHDCDSFNRLVEAFRSRINLLIDAVSVLIACGLFALVRSYAPGDPGNVNLVLGVITPLLLAGLFFLTFRVALREIPGDWLTERYRKKALQKIIEKRGF